MEGKKINKCLICSKEIVNVCICKICGFNRYCSRDCKKKDYKNHKMECMKLLSVPSIITKKEISINYLIKKTSEIKEINEQYNKSSNS